MIYIISNVLYPQQNRLKPQPQDLLVFINKAKSINYYKQHKNKLVIHRKQKEHYGQFIEGIPNYCFDGQTQKYQKISSQLKRRFLQDYDYSFSVLDGRLKCATTGYLTVKFIQHMYPGEQITLVNFGFAVQKSSYRDIVHNWVFQDKVLQKYKHIYTAKTWKQEEMNIVYCCDQTYIDKLKMSIDTVLKYNPEANITVLSATKLDIPYQNIVVDTSKYNFKQRADTHVSNATYLKLFIPQYIKKDKVLLLDADILCRNSIQQLYNKDIKYIGMTHSHDCGINQAKKIGIPTYMLASMLLMNLKNLRQIQFTKIALFAMQNFKFPATAWQHDQTILNCCFYKFIQPIDIKWNYCYNRSYKAYKQKTNMGSAVLIHFIGPQKQALKQFYEKEMRNNTQQTQLKDQPFQDYKKDKALVSAPTS